MKKKYFQSRSLKEIEELDLRYEKSNLPEKILNLKDDEGLIIPDLIPFYFNGHSNFLKHGEDVKLKRAYSLDEILKEKDPYELRKEAFNRITNPFYSGYTFNSIGLNRTLRKVSLVDCVEGAKLYTYSKHFANIEIDFPRDKKRIPKTVDEVGMSIVVIVPSRTDKSPRYKFEWHSIPILDDGDGMKEYNNKKKKIARDIITVGHNCGDKLYNKELRYTKKGSKKSSRITSFCAHEIASYFAICEYYALFNNKIPLQMCQFAIPTQLTADYYKKLNNNLLINKRGIKLQKPDRGNMEILLWWLVMDKKTKNTFFSNKKLENYKW